MFFFAHILQDYVPKNMFFMFHIIVDYTSHKNILNAAFTYVFEPSETLFSFFNAYLLYFLDIFSGWILAGILITSKHGYRCTLVCCSLLSVAQFFNICIPKSCCWMLDETT